MKYSCLIIGAGPAALQAGLFLGRAKVETLIIGIPEKSDLAYGKEIGNFFGIPEVLPGATLLQNAVEMNKKYGIEVVKKEVINLQKIDSIFKAVCEDGTEFETDNVIIATGRQYVKAGIEGEDKFFGRGVHTCVACDGPIFKNKKVAFVGSGSHALAEAIEEMTYTKDVTVFTQGDAPSWSKELEASAKEKGVTISEAHIKSLKGEKMISSVALADGSEAPMDAVFIVIGSASSITFAYKLGLEQKDNFLVIDNEGKTSMDGVWAAGACAGGVAQIAKSVGEGCIAAISVIKKTKDLAQYVDQT